jgi:hypothetical protein
MNHLGEPFLKKDHQLFDSRSAGTPARSSISSPFLQFDVRRYSLRPLALLFSLNQRDSFFAV